MAITYEWRGEFNNVELNELHAEAFETRVFDEAEWNWGRPGATAQSQEDVDEPNKSAVVPSDDPPKDTMVLKTAAHAPQ